MKSRRFVALVILFSSVLMLSTTLSNPRLIVAQGQPPLPTVLPRQGFAANEYLIPIPLPQAETLNVPPDLTSEHTVAYLRALAYRQAQPILAELEQLRSQGQLMDFEVRPDLFAVVVQVASQTDVTATLAHLSGDTLVFAADKQILACIHDTAQALKDEVAGLSQRPTPQRNEADGVNALAIQATNPSIDVYVSPGSTWTYVTGSTTPDTGVAFRLSRNGKVIAMAATVSNSDGRYYLYPSYQSCPINAYNWILQNNDVVEITAAGQTASTTVVSVVAWIDPVANIVGGTAAAGRSVEVQLYHYPNDFCTSTRYTQTSVANGSGGFSTSFNSLIDFNRRASATVYARDANGNSTFASFYAYRIGTYFGYSSYWGYLKPNVSFTASLSRNGSIISTGTGTSNARGYYYGYFNYTIQSGDVISVNGGDVAMQYIATNLTNVVLNPTSNQATGTTGANRRVAAQFNNVDWAGPVQTSCSYNESCASTISNGSGNFTLNAGFDLVRGDYTYIDVFDSEGNFQSSDQFSVPAIVANLSWNEVDGYWSTPDTYLTIILKNSGNTVISTNSTWSDYDTSFYAYVGTISPTDKIEVGNGVITQTMTVQNLTGRLRGDSGHLAGTAYNGHLLAQLWDFQRPSGYWYSYCREINLSGNAYDLTFSGAQVGGQDQSAVWNTGPDGHYTRRAPYAFSVNVQKDSNYVWGYNETPFAAITLTLKTGVTTRAVYTTTSYSDGYYNAYGIPAVIAQGDTVNVKTGDGSSAVVNIPELTVNQDMVTNRVYGRAPANEPILASINKASSSNSWYSTSARTATNPAGNYSASFNDLYLSCTPAQVGSCTWAGVIHYTAAGHSVRVTGPQPSPAAADAYEPDNTPAAASYYTGQQHHSFHVNGDSDWIKFAVSAADVSNHVAYRFQTFNLGLSMDTTLSLYGTDGSTLLAYNDDWGGSLASAIDWTPPVAGTYYLQANPFGSSDSAYCDASYDLSIVAVHARVFLPVLLRSTSSMISISYFAGPFEIEPNNTVTQTNGLLRSGQDYFGYPDDQKDYFSFLTSASGSITIDLTNYTGGNGQLQLFYQSTGNLVKIVPSEPYSLNYSGPAGLYYIYVNTGSNTNDTVPYTLRVTYP